MVGTRISGSKAQHPHGTDDSRALSCGSLVSCPLIHRCPRAASPLVSVRTNTAATAAADKKKIETRMRELNSDISLRQ
jgi:hypothetical protein